jgi:protein-disulfide isomerase
MKEETKSAAGYSSACRRALMTVVSAAAAGLAMMVIGVAPLAAQQQADSDKVVATVGDYKITESQVDEKLKPQIASWQSRLYQMRRQAIEQIADDYLIQQAARKDNLTVEQYIKKALGPPPQITEKDARNYYDSHQGQIGRPYDQIKQPLINALQRRAVQQQREDLIEKLQADNHVKIMIEPPRMTVDTTGHPSLGPDNAPVTIAEFGDFQCPYCGRSEQTVKELRQEYGDKIRIVYLDFPLSFHEHAFPAALAARCAGEQHKFWEYHDALFANQSKLTDQDLKDIAKQLKLDMKRFDACFANQKYAKEVRADMEQGSALGVDGTPGFFVNGRPVTGAEPTQVFEGVINEELAHKAQGQKAASAGGGNPG